ncbi:MAG: glucosaminidase domain-containing protein [Lacibacter sp.]|jgi:LysM repeat protein
MKRTAVFLLFWIAALGSTAQRITVEEYIAQYKDIAMDEMVRTGVPAAIKLAQGIVETESGNSPLVKKSNNHFGIKCKETWTGPWVSHDDDAPKECFRKYNDAIESYIDHSNFLRTRKHYNFLFSLDPTDYKAWAYGLKKAGYATNPRYPEMLIKYIETYNLNQYSLLALQRMPANGAGAAYAKSESKVALPQPEAVSAQPPVKKEAAGNKQTVAAAPEQPSANTAVTPAVATAKEPVVQQPVVQKPVRNYPEGEFRINETRVVFAKAGTPLLALAQQYNVPLKYLLDFNDLPEIEQLREDQLIYLQRKRRTGANAYHIVKPGETLYDIAQEQGIRLEALLQLNQLNAKQQPAVGEQLYLQAPAPAAPRLSNTTPVTGQPQGKVEKRFASATDEIVIHIVQPGETLYGIARRYDVSVTALQQWNRLSGTDLAQGMELIINKAQYVGHQGTR